MGMIRALKPINAAMVGALFDLGYVGNFKEVTPIEKNESKYQINSIYCINEILEKRRK